MTNVIDYSNDFVKTKVNRSNSLKCTGCGKAIPMETKVVFELSGGNFRGVFCMTCFQEDEKMQTAFYDQRHPFDLEE